MPQVDPVILRLEADVAKYNANVSNAQKLTDQKLGAIEARGFAMGQSLKKGFDLARTAAIAYASTIGVQALTGAITKGLEHASALGEQAAALGVTTSALQEYRYAATQSGLSAEEMDQALSQLTRRIGEAASGTKEQAKAFEKLGITVKDVEGNVLDAGDAIPQIADALAKIESPAERAALLMDLFGRSGQKLESLLAGGAGAVNSLRDAAHSLGIVLSEQQIQNADKTADKLAALKEVMSARIAGAVADNAASIYTLVNALADMVNWLGKADAVYRSFQATLKMSNAQAKQYSPLPGVRREGKREVLDARQQQWDAFVAGTPGLSGPVGGGRKSAAALGTAAPTPGAAAKASPKGGGYSGPSAAEIARRFNDELISIATQTISAYQSVATSADERAELELQTIEWARKRSIADVKADQDYSKAQKAAITDRLNGLAEAERAAVERRRAGQLEQEANEMAETTFKAAEDQMQLQLDLADTDAERKRIALELVDLELRHREAMLQSVIASEVASEADKQRARAALSALQSTAGLARESAARANETEGQRYLRDVSKTAGQINEAIDGIKIDGLEELNDGLVEAIMGARSLGDVFKSVANQIIADLLRIAVQQAVIKPLAEGLFGGGGGGGGGLLGGLLSAVGLVARVSGGGGGGGEINNVAAHAAGFGRASGGYVAPGQMVRVNEGASPGRVEAFMSRDGGKIIPLGQMDALRSQQSGGGIATVRLELSGDIDARIQRVSGPVAVEVVRTTAPAIIDASARETLSRAGRPKL